MNRWFVSRQGKLTGPFTLPQLQEMAKAGTLRPADLVCSEGGAPTTASRVLGLFADNPAAPPKVEPPPVSAGAAIAAPPESVTAQAKPPTAEEPELAAAPWALPKPVLFAVCGALGGFVAAFFIGEPAWFLFSPPEIQHQPSIRIAASKSMNAYIGSKQRLNVRVARDRWNGVVQLQLDAPPAGVSAQPITIPAGASEAEAQVEVDVERTVAQGSHQLGVVALSPNDHRLRPAQASLNLVVLPPPPSLGVTVSPTVVLDQGGKRRFTVRIARTKYQGPVNVEFLNRPPGISFPICTIPSESDDVEVETGAAINSAIGTHPVTVEITSIQQDKQLRARGHFHLVIRPRPKVDVVFVLDLTGSMQASIDGIKNGIGDFTNKLERHNTDVRVGLVGFRDIEDQYYVESKFSYPHGEPFALKFRTGEILTNDYQSFREKLGEQKAEGGAQRTKDESSLQALAYAAKLPFRRGSMRSLILVTDAGPRVHKNGDRFYNGSRFNVERPPYSIAETIPLLKKASIAQLHMVVTPADYDGTAFELSKKEYGSPTNPYRQFHSEFKGKYYSIDEIAGQNSFEKILPELSQQIGSESAPPPPPLETPPPIPPLSVSDLPPPAPPEGLPSAVSIVAYAEKDRGRLVFAIALWTTFIAAGISLLISLGQQFYLRKGLLQFRALRKAMAGGTAAGLIGGSIGQLFVQSTAGGPAWEIVSRIIGWSMLGSIVGMGMSVVVPNLKWSRGLTGGFIGGSLGAGAFLVISLSSSGLQGTFGQAFGRLAGAAVLGFCIGLMVAVAELAFRRWWLEIAFGSRELRTVTLGSVPVVIGSDERRVSVFVPGATPIALRYRLNQDAVLCEDLRTGQTSSLSVGDKRRLDGVTITVCSPAIARKIGLTLHLFNGSSIVLRDGVPLTSEDIPGLEPQGSDGIVAIVSPRPNDPKALLLRNRSRQVWTIKDISNNQGNVEPGRGMELTSGSEINFGRVHGKLVHDAAEKPGQVCRQRT